MIVFGPLVPGTTYVRLTAATGTLAANLDNKDVLINTLNIQSGSGNNAVGLLKYNGDEIAELNDPATTGDLPLVTISSPEGAPNAYNLKLFEIKGDSDDVYRCWATQH